MDRAGGVFTSTTIPRHRLLRAFPHMSTGAGLSYLDQPLGVIKAHSLEVVLNRRYSTNPVLDPTNTNFGQIRAVNNTAMRFFTFNITTRF